MKAFSPSPEQFSLVFPRIYLDECKVLPAPEPRGRRKTKSEEENCSRDTGELHGGGGAAVWENKKKASVVSRQPLGQKGCRLYSNWVGRKAKCVKAITTVKLKLSSTVSHSACTSTSGGPANKSQGSLCQFIGSGYLFMLLTILAEQNE